MVFLKRVLCLLVGGFLVMMPLLAKAEWSLSVASGVDYNIPLRLRIRQNTYPNIIVKNARYNTYPFQSPPFYDIRLGKWYEGAAWELEFLHHKIYLQNGPSEIQNFSISHGYNLLYINRAWLLKHDFRFRIGLGMVIAHPENRIRGQAINDNRGGPIFNGGYYIAGYSGQIGAGRRFYLNKHIYGLLGAKLLGSYAWVPVAHGYATVPNIAVYGIFGLGVNT